VEGASDGTRKAKIIYRYEVMEPFTAA